MDIAAQTSKLLTSKLDADQLFTGTECDQQRS